MKLLKFRDEEAAGEKMAEKAVPLALVCFFAKLAVQKGGRWITRLEVETIAGKDGGLEMSPCEVGTAD